MTRISPRALARLMLPLLAATMIGCAKNPPPAAPIAAIPSNALFVRDGIGKLRFEATDPGVVYVYDASTTKLVLAAPIEKDQRFILDPDNSRATVEATIVYKEPISRKHIHRIYFAPFAKLPPPPTQPAN